ncbi:MAG: LPS export ABC transporter periplasmic protein LptC [Fusobacterium sp.]|uniref:LPS export ABC transporter periplasmic protein LptC n=1 Tax=Fusobacterium sp. TaxID=68766 RepID=UPI0026DD82F1|nr:LPS export ABC transporter periplasmic protein LptC [Fusobacterium sp.]MDO4690705.1 LPS export ABC transporter periplasmic protein LptC [Fusobacterium sp.]
MNKKKIIYIVIGSIFLVLGYLNYFGEESKIKEVRKVIETKNAVYEADGYYVEAEKEFDYIDDKESVFEKAKAKIKGMILSGDNVLLDKARNLILNSNIVGISPNGWKINASELKYEKDTETLSSQSLVSAINEKEGIEISGNKFKTNISMDYILLEDGVVIKNKFLSLMADSAQYSSETKKILLKGKINIVGLGNVKDEEGKSKLSGKFNEVYYNLDERNLYAENGFEIDYENISLIGDKFVLNDKEESFKINGNVQIKYQDYLFYVDRIEKDEQSQIINIYGKIKGGNPVYNLSANMGTYNIETKTFKIEGDVSVESVNSETLIADKLEFNTVSKDLNAYGSLLKYSSPTNNLEAEYFIYNTESKVIKTDKKFYAFNEKNQSIRGTDLYYNLATKDFSATNELTLSNGNYELKGENISYVEETGFLKVPEYYELRNLEGDVKLIGNNIVYNRKSGDLISENELNLFSKTGKLNGKNLTYNSNTTLGKIEGPINFDDREKNIYGTAKEIIIKTGDYIKLMGPVNARQNEIVIDTEDMVYKYSDALIHIENPISFKDNKTMVGKVSRASYDPKKAFFKGYNFDMKDATRSAKSDEILYYTNENKLELLKNVVLVSDRNNIRTQNLVYNTKTSDIELKSASQIFYDDYLIKSTFGKVNNKTGEIYVKNANIVSSDKSEFYADTTSGNINNGLINFRGNVKSKVYDKNNEKTEFNGEMLDLYLQKIGDTYKAKKLIMNEKGIFTQLNKKLETDNMEADLEKNIVYLKNRPIITVDNAQKGNTIAKSDFARVLMDDRIIYLDGSVYVKDINEKNEEITMTSNRAEIKNNVASVYEKVKIVNKESILTANEGHYDMDTKKVRLKGNVHVDYVTEKGAGK